MQVVLEGGSCQQQFALIWEHSNFEGEIAFFIFYFMGFIDDQVVPFYFLQIFYGGADGFVAGDDHIEFPWRDDGETNLSLFFGGL